MITPADIKNPKRKSGYSHVRFEDVAGRPKPYVAEAASGTSKPNGTGGKTVSVGPHRASAAEAAQDYCDHINGNTSPPPVRLKSAGHKVPRTPRKPGQSKRLSNLLAEKRRIDAEIRAEQKDQPGFIYLIGESKNWIKYEQGVRFFAVNNEGVFVKIVFSTNPHARLATLQTGNPRKLTILGTIPGTKADEGKLHQEFIHHNKLQEWFRPTPSLLLKFNIKEV